MYHIANPITPLNEAVNNYITAFKSEILALHTTQWNQEDIRGKSYSQWKIAQYYNLMYLLILVHEEVTRTKNLSTTGWAEINAKFNLTEIEKCIACEDINWDKAVEAFGLLDIIPEDVGIELMEIEDNLIVGEDEDIIDSTRTIKDLIANPYTCINYIT